MNHTRFPKKDHLPQWARSDNQVKKGDRVEHKLSEVAIKIRIQKASLNLGFFQILYEDNASPLSRSRAKPSFSWHIC